MDLMEVSQLGANYATIAQAVIGVIALVISVLALKTASNSDSVKKMESRYLT
jgi:hypothetical protein